MRQVSEEVGQMMDDHIVAVQALSFSPFKKPFEDLIFKWENKLKTCQVWWGMLENVGERWFWCCVVVCGGVVGGCLVIQSSSGKTSLKRVSFCEF